MESYICSKCGKEKTRKMFHEKQASGKPVHSHCKNCRKGEHNKKGGMTCSGCELYQKIQENGYCKRCNSRRGLKRCRKCSRFKLAVEFYLKKADCKECYGAIVLADTAG